MNPQLLGFLFAAAPIAYDVLKSKRKRKTKRRRKARRAKHTRRRSRR